MAKSYFKEEFIEKLNCALKKEGPAELYRLNEINYRGKTKDSKELYTEVFAEWLLSHFEVLDGISIHNRKLPYRIASHENRAIPTSNRTEEIIAIKLYKSRNTKKVLDAGFGVILDYQIPLKVCQSDNAGKIDLLSQNGDDILILELKKPDSKETMLRCVLEAFTYSKMLVPQKLFSEYGINHNATIVPAPLVFEKSDPYLDYDVITHPKLFDLIERLQVKPFFISESLLAELPSSQ